MGNLILSSTTVFTDWDINDILDQKSNSKNWDLERINQYNTDNTIGPYCDVEADPRRRKERNSPLSL